MNRWLLAMGLALAMTAFAQTGDAPEGGAAAAAEPVDPCAVPPTEVAPDAPVDPDQPPPEPGAEQDPLGRVGADGLPCPPLEAPVDAALEPQADGNPDENPQPEPPVAGKAEDFEPDEEISEDYPVPLPSDI